MNFDEKIKELKIELPDAKAPVGSYVATKIIGKLLYVSGQISIDSKGDLIKGTVGKDLTTDEAYEAAKRCGLSIVAQVKNACDGDLSKIKSCIKLTGFVNSTEDYIEQPKVINGASPAFYMASNKAFLFNFLIRYILFSLTKALQYRLLRLSNTLR